MKLSDALICTDRELDAGISITLTDLEACGLYSTILTAIESECDDTGFLIKLCALNDALALAQWKVVDRDGLHWDDIKRAFLHNHECVRQYEYLLKKAVQEELDRRRHTETVCVYNESGRKIDVQTAYLDDEVAS